jgi:hypothetical protein
MKKDLLIPTFKDEQLMLLLKWWERKRIWFNFLVGLSGLLPLLFTGLTYFNLLSLLGICFYGLMANICYSLGFLSELLIKLYIKPSFEFGEKRKLVFLLGTAFSMIVTFTLSYFTSLLIAIPF